MKKSFLFILVFAMSVLLCGCCLSHEWMEASCTAPKTCSKCEKTEGVPLGHQWKEATCTAPKTCVGCGMTEGRKTEHTFGKEEIQNPNYVKATATFVKTCTVCGELSERKGDLEKLHDGKVFLLTPEEFSERFTNILMDNQYLVGNDHFLSFIDTAATSDNLKMYMCRRNTSGNIRTTGEFEMMAYGCRESLVPEQREEPASFQKVHGIIKDNDSWRLAMVALIMTVEPTYDDMAAINTLRNWDLLTDSNGVSLIPFQNFLMEIQPKGGSTYWVSIRVR